MKLQSWLDYRLVTQAKEQELKLLVRLSAPAARLQRRKPVNLAVVVDRSGSMAGEKLERTQEALRVLISHLGPEDRLSIVQFDDTAEVLLEPAPVVDKDALKQLVSRIEPGGSTNLSAGWLQGMKLAGRSAGGNWVNRCLLLTDGQANVGIQEPGTLAFLGRSARQEWNITTTTLGFGDGFNEDLLTAIAREAGGAFYFVDQPEHAPAIFAEELQGLLKLVAQNIEVHLQPRAPVAMAAQWTSYPTQTRAGGGLTFALGDAYAGEEKNLLLSLLVPGLPTLGPATLATLEVRCDLIGEQEVKGQRIRQQIRVQVADAGQAAGQEPEVVVEQQYGLQLAAQARRRAIDQADRGDYGQARETLRQTLAVLDRLPDTDGLIREEITDLRAQALKLTQADYASNRKVMRETACCLSGGSYGQLRSARRRRAGRTEGAMR